LSSTEVASLTNDAPQETNEPTLNSTIGTTMVAVELSSDALRVVTDIGELAFNDIFRNCPVVQYERNGAIHSIYKRISPIPEDFNAYQIFTDTWRDAPSNKLDVDFEIFSSLDDLLNDENQWIFCNYNDPDVAYPRDCGPRGSVGNQWFSMPGGIFNARGVTNGLVFKLFNRCPIGELSIRPSGSPSQIPTSIPTRDPSEIPSFVPSTSPSNAPSATPSVSPSNEPTEIPTKDPSVAPSMMPTTTCVTFEFSCEQKSDFGGLYSLQTTSYGENTWTSTHGDRLEQLVLNKEIRWVFQSPRSGLLISQTSDEDFRLIDEWTTNFVDTVNCKMECSESYYPTNMPTTESPTTSPSKSPDTTSPTVSPSKSPEISAPTSSPSLSPFSSAPSMSPSEYPTKTPSLEPSVAPTLMPRYDIEVEHHLSGIKKKQWDEYEVGTVYLQALAFVFTVPEEEIDIVLIDSIDPVNGNRRVLQTPTLMIRAIVSFTDHKRFEEYRNILDNAKGRTSLNNYFNYLFTDKESQLDNIDVQHMGISGEFDMISYFTTVPPTSAPSAGPTPYVDNGDAVMIQEEFQGAQLELHFEGALHYDVDFHDLLTDILNDESITVADTQVLASALIEGAHPTHSVIVNLDCNFIDCAPTWRNETRLAIVEHRIRQDARYSRFEIVSSDVSRMENGNMNVVELTKENQTYLILSIGVAVVLIFVLFYKYWKACFFKKSLGHDDIDVKHYVGEVLAVEDMPRNALASYASFTACASDTEQYSEFEGCETLDVNLAVIEERDRDFVQPAPGFYDAEGFAPTQPKRFAGGESESELYERRNTQECTDDVYTKTPNTKRVPSSQKRKLATFGHDIPGVATESDSDVTLYDNYWTTTLASDSDVLGEAWTPKTTKGHKSTWE